MAAWTQTEHGFQAVTATVPISGTDATLSGIAPFLRFTDTDAGHEDWRFHLDADVFKLQWLSGTGPDVFTDVLSFSDPAAAARVVTLTDYALYFTGLDAAQVFLQATVLAEANPQFRINTAGKEEWGPGGGTAVDTALERTGVGILQTATLRVTAAPSDVNDATRKTYVDTQDALKLSLAGGTMTGFIVLHANPSAAFHPATKTYVDSLVPAGGAVSKTGDTMTGALRFDFSAGGTLIQSLVGAEANPRWRINREGKIEWGPGGATAPDVSQERSAANTLQMASIGAGTFELKLVTGTGAGDDALVGFYTDAGVQIFQFGIDKGAGAGQFPYFYIPGAHSFRIFTDGTLRFTVAHTTGTVTIEQAINVKGALDHDGTTVGFYAKAPAAQAAASANLVDNSGGAATGTIADTPAAYGEVYFADTIASLTAKINKALTVLRDVGLMA